MLRVVTASPMLAEASATKPDWGKIAKIALAIAAGMWLLSTVSYQPKSTS